MNRIQLEILIYNNVPDIAARNELLVVVRRLDEQAARVAALEATCRHALKWLDEFGKHAPIQFGGEQELHDALQNALKGPQS